MSVNIDVSMPALAETYRYIVIKGRVVCDKGKGPFIEKLVYQCLLVRVAKLMNIISLNSLLKPLVKEDTLFLQCFYCATKKSNDIANLKMDSLHGLLGVMCGEHTMEVGRHNLSWLKLGKSCPSKDISPVALTCVFFYMSSITQNNTL